MKSETKSCPISGDEMDFIFQKKVLGNYEVKYYKCLKCGLIQTEKAYWLDKAYENAITALDLGLASRNYFNRLRLEPLLWYLFDRKSKYVDIGGGYGLLTRLMRDIGFDFLSYDIYCENIFAKSYEPGAGQKFDALFAFEVFEHIEEPLIFLKENLENYGAKTMVFSTLTFKETIPAEDWWYYSFDIGQHVSLYQEQSIHEMANKVGLTYYPLSNDLHIITDRKINPLFLFLYRNKTLNKVLRLFTRFLRRKESLLNSDYENQKRILQQLQKP